MTITLKDPTGPYQMLLDSPDCSDPPGPTWTLLDPSGPSWTLLDPTGPSWTLLHPNVPYRSNVTKKGLQ